MRDLTAELIHKVATEVADGDWSYGHASATGISLAAELEAHHGARFCTDREPMRMKMAGVRVSSTGGYSGLFNNWVSAARRKLVQP